MNLDDYTHVVYVAGRLFLTGAPEMFMCHRQTDGG